MHVEEQDHHIAQVKSTNMYMLKVLLHFLKQAFFSLPITNSPKQLFQHSRLLVVTVWTLMQNTTLKKPNQETIKKTHTTKLLVEV